MSELFTRILLWLGNNPTQPDDVDLAIEHSWRVPHWLPLLVFLSAAGLVTWLYVRERGTASVGMRIFMAALRLALVGLVILMMYGFSIRPYRTDRPDLVLLLDDSGSMNLADDSEQNDEARIGQLRNLLLANDEACIKHLSEQYNLKIAWLSQSAALTNGSSITDTFMNRPASHTESRIGDRVRELLRGQRGRPTAAMIVMTDGVITTGRNWSDAALEAQSKSIPLYLVGIGNDQPKQDIAIASLLADDAVFVDDILDMQVNVSAIGKEGESATVRIVRPGDQTPLASQAITLGPDRQTVTARLQIRPATEGSIEYLVEVVPTPDEQDKTNNQRQHTVEVRRSQLKVLLVWAYPSYEFRFLKNMFDRAARADKEGRRPWELKTVLQSADVDYSATDRTALRVFPVRRDELLEYDVVIFGDVDTTLLTRSVQENLRDFVVQRGGGILFAAGPRYTPSSFVEGPLSDVLPVSAATTRPLPPPYTNAIRPQLTRLGMRTPYLQLGKQSAADNARIWNSLAPLFWMVSAPDPKAGAVTLVEHPTATDNNGQKLPIVSLQYVGAGKVIFHATDETWRWQLASADGAYDHYWMQTIRFLGRTNLGESGLVELTSDRREYDIGDSVELRVRFLDERRAPAADDGVSIMLQEDGGAKRRVELRRVGATRGLFTGKINNLSAGSFHSWVVSPSQEGPAPACDFRVTRTDNELTNTNMATDELREAAQISRGKFYTVATAGDLLAELPHGRHVRMESLPPLPIWNSWKIALLFVGILVTEWLLRKRAGLL